MFIRILCVFFFLAIFFSNDIYAQKRYKIEGKVKNLETDEIITSAFVQFENKLNKKSYTATSDNTGSYIVKNIDAGEYNIIVRRFDYQDFSSSTVIKSDTKYNILLSHLMLIMPDVYITASESKGLTSASVIDSAAMRHLQPTSFADVLELMPGGKTIDPAMGSANLIKIREAGQTAMSSLGVGFLVDGAPINNDANLQASINGGTSDSQRNSISKGVDMRTISTDNIQSIEIIRGIPSVEYGNLTNGLVIIKRKSTATPYTARFKVDQYSKLFSAGKGIALGKKNDVLNLDLSYLDSKVDPRNSLENYKRFTMSTRWNGDKSTDLGVLKYNFSADYTGSFDNVKTDPDIMARNDEYKSSYNSIRAGGVMKFDFENKKIVRSITATVSATQEISKITQKKDITLNKPTAMPILTEDGEADGILLPNKYTSDLVIDGKPMYLNTQIMSESLFKWGRSFHTVKLGVNWSLSKNFGKGEIYDPSRPANISSASRPQNFSTIPSTQRLAFFAEDKVNILVNGHEFLSSIGLRGTTALNLSDEFAIKEKVYLDPRFNAMWKFPNVNGWEFDLSAGIGWLSMMPTTSQLYPRDKYLDITQINYFHNNPDFRIVNFMTYKWDNTNYDLQAARNRKWEVRLGVNKEGNNFSITYFNEKMTNGFGYTSYYRSSEFKRYDINSINETELTGKPDLDNVAYSQDAHINSYTQVGNVANTYKEGVEFQFSSKRIEAIKTRISVNGAWFNTRYSNSSPQYKEKDILLNGNQLEYVGLYQWESGDNYQQFYTNIVFDTFLDRIGLIFSLSIQCQWYKDRYSLWNDGTPTHYVDKWGNEHIYKEADRTDMVLQHLVTNYYDGYFDVQTTPFAMDVNLKVTKKIGKYLQMSLYVNRLLTLYPDYYIGNSLVRRVSSPYFGMEANFAF